MEKLPAETHCSPAGHSVDALHFLKTFGRQVHLEFPTGHFCGLFAISATHTLSPRHSDCSVQGLKVSPSSATSRLEKGICETRNGASLKLRDVCDEFKRRYGAGAP